MEAFLEIDPASDFSIDNLPYGCYSTRGGGGNGGAAAPPRRALCVALGNSVVDLGALQRAGLFSGPVLSKHADCFQTDALNGFMALGQPAWREARATLRRLLSASEAALRDDAALRAEAIVPMSDVTLHLPFSVGDYTDFYASRYHAHNCGVMFRDASVALPRNWLHLPIGYHGRASSIVVSGTPVQRPRGQVLDAASDTPVMRPCAAVDFELEVACVMGTGNELGSSIPADGAAASIFGLALMNDWSARDVQQWEMLPLGPFNSKNWATQLSPWVVTLEALEPFRCDAPVQEPGVLPYLREADRHVYDINLTASILPEGGPETLVAESNYKHIYWTFPQMAAHHTFGGCNLRTGDVLGSGTCSGPGPNQRACLLERTWGGKDPVKLEGGAGQRTYLRDGDSVVIRGWAGGGGGGGGAGRRRVGFGECRGKLLPSPAL
ncbi:fumarylacetoacetase [Raphidocelis subcapitata]|uniref:Fumarylacetoacetase n=1 Tax=Raphidocelis subcapitata TaxID=307507 RepID=A0A2V0P803_9CHLO|nr:fumarylacetoacetase [Raphidocelis subcapitata]|eukprot:GBF94003.1 fumarylacetoacetase [Raphidocelis subcapitata]